MDNINDTDWAKEIEADNAELKVAHDKLLVALHKLREWHPYYRSHHVLVIKAPTPHQQWSIMHDCFIETLDTLLSKQRFSGRLEMLVNRETRYDAAQHPPSMHIQIVRNIFQFAYSAKAEPGPF